MFRNISYSYRALMLQFKTLFTPTKSTKCLSCVDTIYTKFSSHIFRSLKSSSGYAWGNTKHGNSKS